MFENQCNKKYLKTLINKFNINYFTIIHKEIKYLNLIKCENCSNQQ